MPWPLFHTVGSRLARRVAHISDESVALDRGYSCSPFGVLGEQNPFSRRSRVVEMGGPHFSQKAREMGHPLPVEARAGGLELGADGDSEL